ncbi:ras guanine nucleotide exchange factor domain-containing protein [Obelidium mucronatum]|nr:ras guanine nucleotide exchange factor domain-containing protein [Obelidium mucronatum]
MLKNTRFEQLESADDRAKNLVTSKPPDSERLFGLAHLCFTEAEDIVNGEVNFDDLESATSDSDSDADAGAGADSDADADSGADLYADADADADADEAPRAEPAAKTLAAAKPQRAANATAQPPSPLFGDFRQTRLTRPRSICSSIRSSVRLSVMAMNATAPGNANSPLPENASDVLPELGGDELSLQGGDLQTKPHPPLLPPAYIPLIPSSPLQLQHSHILQSYSRCSQELDRLNTMTTSSSAAALQTLSVVRRLLETSTILKSKLTAVATEISVANAKSIVDFTPRQLAVNITLCDWELFNFITVQDLLVYTVSSGGGFVSLPRSFKSCMDFSIFISRLVSFTIASSLQSSKASVVQDGIALTVTHWLQTLTELLNLKNYQSVHAVLAGLTHPSISRILNILKLPKPLIFTLHTLLELLNPANSFQNYNTHISSKVVPPLIPLLGAFVDSLKKIPSLAPTENKMLMFANLQGVLEQWRGNSDTLVASQMAGRSTTQSFPPPATPSQQTTPYADEKQERNVSILHYILSRMWVSEAVLWELSHKIVPAVDTARPESASQSVGKDTAVVHGTTMPTSTLSKSTGGLNFLSKIKQGMSKKGSMTNLMSLSETSLNRQERDEESGRSKTSLFRSHSTVLELVTTSITESICTGRDPNDHVYQDFLVSFAGDGQSDAGVGLDVPDFIGNHEPPVAGSEGTTTSLGITSTKPAVATAVPAPVGVTSSSSKGDIDALRLRLDQLKKSNK